MDLRCFRDKGSLFGAGAAGLREEGVGIAEDAEEGREGFWSILEGSEEGL